MILTEIDYEKFREIYKNHYGKEISMGEAIEMGDRLVRYIRTIHKIKWKKYDQLDVGR